MRDAAMENCQDMSACTMAVRFTKQRLRASDMYGEGHPQSCKAASRNPYSKKPIAGPSLLQRPQECPVLRAGLDWFRMGALGVGVKPFKR